VEYALGVRRGLAVALAASILVGAVSAAGAGSATPAKRYFRVAAGADFAYDLDYGSHPDAVFNGTYEYLMAFSVNAIAVYDGRQVWVPQGAMVVHGFEYVDERRTQWALSGRVPLKCPNDYRSTKEQKAVFSSGAVGVSNSGVSVDPGPALRFNLDCSATEGLATHGLKQGPQFVVSTPAKSRFTGTRAFSTGCKDSYSHPADTADVNGHSFTGHVRYWVRFTPFPATKLSETKKALRDKVGTNLPGGFAALGTRNLKDCL
jgi:hypothetical protein